MRADLLECAVQLISYELRHGAHVLITVLRTEAGSSCLNSATN